MRCLLCTSYALCQLPFPLCDPGQVTQPLLLSDARSNVEVLIPPLMSHYDLERLCCLDMIQGEAHFIQSLILNQLEK